MSLSNSSHLSKAYATAQALGLTSWWISPKTGLIVALYLYSPYAYANNEYPYQLRVWLYSPSQQYYADYQQYLGGIGVDGSINTTELNESWHGFLTDMNTIQWNDGSKWYRTTPPARSGMSPYSAEAAYEADERANTFFWNQYDRAYPIAFKKMP